MLRRTLLNTRNFKLGLRYQSTGTADFYCVLEVQRDAEVSEIKAAFRKKAKLLHPDATDCDERGAAQFRLLLSAYQVLVDPAARRVYDLQRDDTRPQFLRDAAEHSRGQGQGDPSAAGLQWDWVRAFNIESDRPAHQHTQLDRMRAELQAEFREALLHAYHGPLVDFTARKLPSCFEAEERSDPAHSDVLQIVSGRQLLAVVRERVDPLLSSSEPSSAGLPDAASGGPALAGQAADTGSQSDAQPAHGSSSGAAFHLHSPAGNADSGRAAGGEGADISSGSRCGRSNSSNSRNAGAGGCADRITASATRKVSDLGDAHSSSSTGSGGGVRRLRVLELVYEDGEVGAVLTHRALPSGATLVDVHRGPHHVYQEAGGGFSTHHTLRVSSRSGNGSSASSGEGRRTHQAIVSETPFVKHLDFIAMKGVGGLKKNRLVCRCKRAWLPPSATWLFPPRSAAHSTGGWYLELPDGKHTGHPAWVAPEALVLRAALDSLLSEAAGPGPAGVQRTSAGTEAVNKSVASLWRRLKAKFSC